MATQHAEEKNEFLNERHVTERSDVAFDDGASATDVVVVRRNSGKSSS